MFFQRVMIVVLAGFAFLVTSQFENILSNAGVKVIHTAYQALNMKA